MIVAFSTSSPTASVAAFDWDQGILWQGSENAPQGASGACLRLLEAMRQQSGLQIADALLFLADIGPGSFTGVRVGVTLAKTFGYLYGRDVAGATSFDLVSPDRTVVFPSKKNEFFVRNPGESPFRTPNRPEAPHVGFGPGIEPQTLPNAAGFLALRDRLVPRDPMRFVPEYLIEPSISIPKKPFGAGVTFRG